MANNMYKTNKFFGVVFSFLFLFVINLLFVGSVFAQPAGNATGSGTGNSAGGGSGNPVSIEATIPNPFKGGDDLMTFLTAIFQNVIMPIAAIGITVWIVWAGFQYVLARGNSTKIADANKNLLWSLIGAGILLGATAISKVVETTVTTLMK